FAGVWAAALGQVSVFILLEPNVTWIRLVIRLVGPPTVGLGLGLGLRRVVGTARLGRLALRPAPEDLLKGFLDVQLAAADFPENLILLRLDSLQVADVVAVGVSQSGCLLPGLPGHFRKIFRKCLRLPAGGSLGVLPLAFLGLLGETLLDQH